MQIGWVLNLAMQRAGVRFICCNEHLRLGALECCRVLRAGKCGDQRLDEAGGIGSN